MEQNHWVVSSKSNELSKVKSSGCVRVCVNASQGISGCHPRGVASEVRRVLEPHGSRQMSWTADPASVSRFPHRAP